MLSDRWQQSPYNTSVYHAEIPNFRNPENTVMIELEETRSGKTEATVNMGTESFKTDKELHDSLEDAAHAALKVVRKMFQHRRMGDFILSFTPLNTDRDILTAFACSQSTANNWRNGRLQMSRRTCTQAVAMMGIRGYGRGFGERLVLEKPTWED